MEEEWTFYDDDAIKVKFRETRESFADSFTQVVTYKKLTQTINTIINITQTTKGNNKAKKYNTKTKYN